MGTRRQARERAIQFLFQYDHNPTEVLDSDLEHFWLHQRPAVIELVEGRSAWGEDREMPPQTTDDISIRNFAEPLVRGVLENRDSIDKTLSQLAENWDLHRMAAVDRNILRLAAPLDRRLRGDADERLSARTRPRQSPGRQGAQLHHRRLAARVELRDQPDLVQRDWRVAGARVRLLAADVPPWLLALADSRSHPRAARRAGPAARPALRPFA